MTDHTADAVAALTHRIRQRDAAIRAGHDIADPEPFALEFMTALTGNGWRPTEARPTPEWRRPAGAGRPPTDDYLHARAEAGVQSRTPGGTP